MNNKFKINQTQLITLLNKLDYVQVKSGGSHLVFKHKKLDSSILLRNAKKNEILLHPVISSVFRNILSHNVVTENQLRIELERITGQ